MQPAYGQRLAREFGQIVAIDNAAPTQAHAQMNDASVHADQADLLYADVRVWHAAAA
jgi:hypothetical protein